MPSKKFFVQCGKRGGKLRAKILSASQRRSIAQQAAQIRWKNPRAETSTMPSTRLNADSWQDPVYVEEILAGGALHDWAELYRRIANHPFGETSEALERVVQSTYIYGATNLWKGLLNNVRGVVRD